MQQPLFIVLEGVDGSGKSTQINLLKSRMQATGMQAVDTHEPTDNAIGKFIRSIMKGETTTDPATTAALFLADRLEHINNPQHGMKRQLAHGCHVICSRYYFSSYAFQSEFVPVEWVVQCNSLCKKQLQPDIIFYLNVDPQTCSERIAKGRDGIEIYETIEKINKAHHAFLAMFEKYGTDENIHIINGNDDSESISNAIWKIVSETMAAKAG
jgi:dTMP kinase